jgi:WD40 repeat protein
VPYAAALAGRTAVRLERWDADSGKRIGATTALSPAEYDLAGFTPDLRRVVLVSSNARRTVLRDTATGAVVRRWDTGGDVAAMTDDGRTLAVLTPTRELSLIALDGRAPPRPAGVRAPAELAGMAFAPDARTLVGVGLDDRVWLLRGGETPVHETLGAHAGSTSAVVTSDSHTAYSAGLDGTVIVWDLTGERGFVHRFRAGAGWGNAAALTLPVTPRGTSFAVAGHDGHVHVFDSAARPLADLRVDPGHELVGVAISPDGATLAANTKEPNSVSLWDVRARRRLAKYGDTNAEPVLQTAALTFTQGGRRLAVGVKDVVREGDARGQEPYGQTDPFGDNSLISAIDLSPNGSQVAVALSQGSNTAYLQIVPVPGLSPIRSVAAPSGFSVEYAPGGDMLVYGDALGRVWLYDTRTWKPRGRELHGPPAPVFSAGLSLDGQLLAAAYANGTVQLWDPSTRRLLATLLGGSGEDHTILAAFVDGGKRLVAVRDDGQGYLWDLRPASWLKWACRVAGRPLSDGELAEALPGRHDTSACP